MRLQSGQVVPAEVEYELEDKDLAVLRPIRAITDCQELPLAANSPRLGQAVMTLGYPTLHNKSEIAAVPGVVVNTDPTSSMDFLIFGLAINGSSGGPIVNTDGEVVGLVWGTWAYERDDEGKWIFVDYLVAAVDLTKHLR